ncbi:MAG: signal peptidase II [Acidobacteriota bacterium]
MKPHYLLAASLAAAVTLLDQATKYLVQKHIILFTGREVIPGFFNLVHTLNKGAAFGFLGDTGGNWQTYFFLAATALAVVIIANLLTKAHPKDTLLVTALGLILGGALGNMVDRIRAGEVIDFLDFYIGSYHWPAFNVADIAITLGSLFLIFSLYERKRP